MGKNQASGELGVPFASQLPSSLALSLTNPPPNNHRWQSRSARRGKTYRTSSGTQIAGFFHREVEAIRGLDHPHIIKLVGLAVDTGRQRLMFAMELMLGGSLRGLLSRARQDPTS